ncbi:MAG: lipid-A-disaccharide synthase [Holosporales bacterium]|jgi:lipid-A-disaccharide synthase|nr:lipid-A-disaccharide synthase [Holosporales bacterium]
MLEGSLSWMSSSYSGNLYIIAGEASGDKLGSRIIDNLEGVEISGVGGPLMEARGFCSLFNINEISVGGIWEAARSILKIRKLIQKTVDDIVLKKPRVILTIDSPEFCFRVACRVKSIMPEAKLIHLVAPSVWAWRPNRAKSIARMYNHIMTLFDFEPPYFTKYGLPATFVGHPAIEEFHESQCDSKESALLLMPGSRVQEVKSHLPVFLEAAKKIEADRIVVPTIDSIRPLVESMINDKRIEVISDESEKMELYRKASFAIVASGTATLHLALSSCPMAVCYRMSPVSYAIIKRLVKVEYISLANIILGEKVVPELIQGACTPMEIVKAISHIDRVQQTSSFRKIRSRLLLNGMLPSKAISTTLGQYLV